MNLPSYGVIDLETLVKNGKIELTLIDSATKRPVSGEYSYKISRNQIEIQSKANPAKILTMDKSIQLTPEIISFIGLYLGDGNKTGDIGFSQREINILKFAHDVENRLFGNNFQNRWSILEDTKRFETQEMQKTLKPIQDELTKTGKIAKEKLSKEVQREFLIREFLERANRIGLKINSSDINKPVISPKKGAKAKGKSSLEYIHDLYGSGLFLPLLLKIVYGTVNSILEGKSIKWIKWKIDPKDSSLRLDVSKYISQIEYKTTSDLKDYHIARAFESNKITIGKKSAKRVTIQKKFPLSPFLFLISGFYLAEGDTKKENIFIFDKKKVPLRVGITSSEERVVRSLVELLEDLGDNLVQKWKVKVGTKYFIETEEIAQKLGVVTLRGGAKGQGYVRTHHQLEMSPEVALFKTSEDFSEPLFSDISSTLF